MKTNENLRLQIREITDLLKSRLSGDLPGPIVCIEYNYQDLEPELLFLLYFSNWFTTIDITNKKLTISSSGINRMSVIACDSPSNFEDIKQLDKIQTELVLWSRHGWTEVKISDMQLCLSAKMVLANKGYDVKEEDNCVIISYKDARNYEMSIDMWPSIPSAKIMQTIALINADASNYNGKNAIGVMKYIFDCFLDEYFADFPNCDTISCIEKLNSEIKSNAEQGNNCMSFIINLKDKRNSEIIGALLNKGYDIHVDSENSLTISWKEEKRKGKITYGVNISHINIPENNIIVSEKWIERGVYNDVYNTALFNQYNKIVLLINKAIAMGGQYVILPENIFDSMPDMLRADGLKYTQKTRMITWDYNNPPNLKTIPRGMYK